MGRHRVDAEALLNMVYERKVVTKAEMIESAACSPMTVWRVLNAHGYLTSYNFNARYYTLRDIPTFDSNGLWFHGRIGFSVHGSLTETVRSLATGSAQGLTCAQLRQRLAVNVGPTLLGLYRAGDLFREKHDGVFVYLASEETRRQAQQNERCARVAALPAAVHSAEVVIAVLVELIQRVELTPPEVAARLLRRGMRVSEYEVQRVFRHYDLQPQKKGLLSC